MAKGKRKGGGGGGGGKKLPQPKSNIKADDGDDNWDAILEAEAASTPAAEAPAPAKEEEWTKPPAESTTPGETETKPAAGDAAGAELADEEDGGVGYDGDGDGGGGGKKRRRKIRKEEVVAVKPMKVER